MSFHKLSWELWVFGEYAIALLNPDWDKIMKPNIENGE
jgi:hypothetical protein